METLIRFTVAAGLALTLLACNSDATLQKYYVEKQNDSDFIALDISSSLFVKSDSLMTAEQKQTLETIKKLNILALQANAVKNEKYTSEKEVIHNILSDSKYKTLVKYGSANSQATLKYLGDETAIDELVVFADDDEQGMALVRVLGDNMNPGKILQMLRTMDTNNIDLSVLQSLENELN